MREQAVLFGRDRSLIGVLTENQSAGSPEKRDLTGVLLLSSGLDHHVGPNRIYVKLARRLAEMGFLVFRFGFSGIGDSGPRRDKLPASESVIDETQQAMNWLADRAGIERFVAIGLCNGAAAAFQIAAVDRRVRGAVLINPPVPATSRTELSLHSYYWRNALFNLRSWKRLLLFQSAYGWILQSVVLRIKSLFWPGYGQNGEQTEIVDKLSKALRCFQEYTTQLLMIVSDEVGGDQYLREYIRKEYASLKNTGLLTTKVLNGTDHVATPLTSQERLLELISTWMAERF